MMFTQVTLDPTAGKRARLIREQPEIPLPVLDPTDPRCGSYPVDPDRGFGRTHDAPPAGDTRAKN